MGTVYLGKITKSRRGLAAGTEVAVKILHPHFAIDPGVRSRFRLEAGLGLTLRHPGIVKILQVGSQNVGDAVVYFIIMEYLRGVTLKAVLDESGTMSDDDLRRIALEIVHALSVIHRRGIIHRDLKPENIFLEKNGKVKVGDFGLSRLTRKPSASLHSGFIGSIAYAAPERFGPASAESPSDLYSLGVVLYEMAVGVNPFLGNDLSSTISNHLYLVPTAPADTGALISPFMSHLIMALLEKEPRRRLGPPDRLIRILTKKEESKWYRTVRPGGAAGPVSRRREHFNLHRNARFHGRTREVDKLLHLVNEVASGKGGRVAVIRGEAGVGKTRLLDRMIEEMERTSLEGDLVMVPGSQSEPRIPYSAVISAVFKALDLRESDRHVLRERLREKMHSHFPARERVAEVITDLLVSILPEGKRETLSPEAATHLFTDLFRYISEKKLMVLVVEDVQGTGSQTRGVLLEMARHIRSMRVMMILTVRTGETPSHPDEDGDPLDGFLDLLEQEGGAEFLELSRLDKQSVKRILADLGFPERVLDKKMVDQVYTATEGNAYFVLEVARLLLDEGVLNREDPDWLGLLRYIPASIQDVFYRRLFKLTPGERRFLDFASIFGLRFRVEEVLAALEMKDADAARVVSRLQNTFSLIRPTVGEMHRFDHVLIRELIYENLDGEVRASYHRRAGAYYEKLGARRPMTGRECLKAAVHFSRGNHGRGALRHFFGAYDYLLFKSAYSSALVLAREAAAHVSALKESGGRFDAELECKILLRLARVASHLGKRDDEIDALKRASVTAGERPALRALVSLMLAQYHAATSRYISALNSVQAALGWMRQTGDRSGEARALQELSGIMRNVDGRADTMVHLEEALAIRKELEDRIGQARILTDMGMIHLEGGAKDKAQAAFRESMALFRKAKDEKGVASILLGLGALHREKERPDLAETALKRGAALAHRIGQSLLRARVLAELGEVYMDEGSFEEAGRTLEEARHLAEDTRNQKLLAKVLAAQACLLARPGGDPSRKGDALRIARQAVAVAREAQLAEGDRINALNALASVYLGMGKYSSALALTRKATRMLAGVPPRTRLEREAFRLHDAARGCRKETGSAGRAAVTGRD